MGTVQERLLDLIEEAGLSFCGGFAVVASFEAASAEDTLVRADAAEKAVTFLRRVSTEIGHKMIAEKVQQSVRPKSNTTTKTTKPVKRAKKKAPAAASSVKVDGRRALKECAACGHSKGATAFSKGSDTCRACDKAAIGVAGGGTKAGPREATRKCAECETVKPVREFDGKMYFCRACMKEDDA